MKIRNLEIIDSLGLEQKSPIENCLSELDGFIRNNYINVLEREIAIEFNLGSKIAPYDMHLVVYNNPERANNPYLFVLAKLEDKRILVNRAELAFFSGLLDYQTFKDFKISLRTGFENLPKFALLGEKELNVARRLSREYDER